MITYRIVYIWLIDRGIPRTGGKAFFHARSISIPIAAAVGIPMYIRTGTIIPISASLVGKGMGLGTAVALPIIGGAAGEHSRIDNPWLHVQEETRVGFRVNVFLVAIAGEFMVEWLA